jgi:Spy/CpxP family protein refolding chaperone
MNTTETTPQAEKTCCNKNKCCGKKCSTGYCIAKILALIALLALAFYAGKYSNYWRMAHHFGGGYSQMHGGDNSARGEWRINRALDYIDATEEQRGKLRPLFTKLREEMRFARDDFKALRPKAIEAITGEKFDRATLEAMRQDQLKMAESGSKRLLDTLEEASTILTPAQKQKLAERSKWFMR